jgi:hemerythrin-like metal-binding protein
VSTQNTFLDYRKKRDRILLKNYLWKLLKINSKIEKNFQTSLVVIPEPERESYHLTKLQEYTMAFMEWNEKLSTGIKEIDNQHKKLVEQINVLHSAMREGKAKEVLGKILDELKAYTKYHFSTEEKAFEKYNFLEKASHTKKHNDLIKQLDGIIDQYKAGSLTLSINLLDFLNKWISEHILKDDMKYAPVLRGKEIDV